MPTIIDLNAEAAKMPMFRGLTPQTKRTERTGYRPRLPSYWGGLLLMGKSAGTSHWETHPEDELVWTLEGTATLDVVQEDGPHAFPLKAGMIAVVPPGVWHRFRKPEGSSSFSAVLPGDHIELDVDDPRASVPGLDLGDTKRSPSIIDLNTERAKLTMFRGMTPQTTFAQREGSAANLGPYRDGILFLSRWSGGKTHWETHPAEELVCVLDGTVVLDIVEEDRLKSCPLDAGKMVIVPRDAWHRFHSADDDYTEFSVTLPGPHIELDVDDPRPALRQAATA